MPEIAEVARVVHFVRKHLVGRQIAAVTAHDDPIVYGKVGCSAAAFEASCTGKRIVGAGQQGKYFWLALSAPPHPLMHFGMTGWLHFSNDVNAPYRENGKEKAAPAAGAWPPRFPKFVLKMEDGTEAAFVDKRRLARIRLVEAEADQLRKVSPLKENGPDPVQDPDVLTEAWLKSRLRGKKVPVKAFLLDQGVISGVGNWVGDEVLYQARIHPEQYTNTLQDAQVAALHTALMTVCNTACDCLAESAKFPADWLMRYRWDKGKKGANTLPNGAKIVHLQVGGRTSAVVPSVQKKTGAVAGDVDADEAESDADVTPPAKSKPAKSKPAKRSRAQESEDEADQDESAEEQPQKKKPVKKEAAVKKEATASPATGRRRSTRLK